MKKKIPLEILDEAQKIADEFKPGSGLNKNYIEALDKNFKKANVDKVRYEPEGKEEEGAAMKSEALFNAMKNICKEFGVLASWSFIMPVGDKNEVGKAKYIGGGATFNGTEGKLYREEMMSLISLQASIVEASKKELKERSVKEGQIDNELLDFLS